MSEGNSSDAGPVVPDAGFSVVGGPIPDGWKPGEPGTCTPGDPPAPVEENPIAEVEEYLQVFTATTAQTSIERLSRLLEGPPAGAARALHLISELSQSYGSMLAIIGVPGVGKQGRRRSVSYGGIVQSSSYGMSPAVPLMAGETDVELLPGGETYGNQLMDQILAIIKQGADLFIKAKSSKSEASKPSGPSAFDIESLTRAYVTAKRDLGGADDIVVKLKTKLDEALAAKELGPASDVEVPPLPDLPATPEIDAEFEPPVGLGGKGMP